VIPALDGFTLTRYERCVPEFSSVDEYIDAQPALTQERLRELRQVVHETLPDAAETISYGMPAYRLRCGWIYFGAAKRHCALYGTAVDLGPEQLRAYAGRKGTLRLPLDKPVPAEAIRQLIEATVAARSDS
jgi:uncharacterized protein YdhG (YjbR/CyaY superfamily)